jgi:transcriptional regulator with XRE-family HTH domain
MSITERAKTSPQPALGVRLRELRRARGLSVRDVAEACGLSSSFLSLVETGRSDITIGRLVRLVAFYGVSLVDLLPEQPAADDYVVHSHDIRLMRSPAEGIDIHLLAPDTHRTMMPMLLTVDPGAALAERGQHPGEEWVHVLEGELVLEVEGLETRVLRTGDSAYYASTRPHRFGNGSKSERLRLICVDTPPNV